MSRFRKTVILTGLLAGTLDISYAFISASVKSGKFPEKMFHYIAGGALGLERSMAGGPAIEFLGLFFHYFIALSFTLLFFLLLPKFRFLAFNKYLVGMLYGVFVNLAMRYLILPLTSLPSQPFLLSRAFVDWLIFGLVFGLPIVWTAYRYHGIRGEPLVRGESA